MTSIGNPVEGAAWRLPSVGPASVPPLDKNGPSTDGIGNGGRVSSRQVPPSTTPNK